MSFTVDALHSAAVGILVQSRCPGACCSSVAEGQRYTGGVVGALVVEVVIVVVDDDDVVDEDVVDDEVDVDSVVGSLVVGSLVVGSSVVGSSVVALVVVLVVASMSLQGFFQSMGHTQVCLSGEKQVPGAQSIS